MIARSRGKARRNLCRNELGRIRSRITPGFEWLQIVWEGFGRAWAGPVRDTRPGKDRVSVVNNLNRRFATAGNEVESRRQGRSARPTAPQQSRVPTRRSGWFCREPAARRTEATHKLRLSGEVELPLFARRVGLWRLVRRLEFPLVAPSIGSVSRDGS